MQRRRETGIVGLIDDPARELVVGRRIAPGRDVHHLEDLGHRDALLDAEGNSLAARGLRYPREVVVEQLHGLPLSRPRADVEGLAHVRHERLHALVVLLGAGQHDRERCLVGPGNAARNRCIDVLNAGGGEDGGRFLSGSDADGRGVDHRLGLAVRRSSDFLGDEDADLPVGQREDDGFGAGGDFGVRLGDCAAFRRARRAAGIGDDE